MTETGQTAPFIPFHRPSIYDHHVHSVVEALRSGWLSSAKKVEEFEGEFAKVVGAKYAVAVNSCTAALHLALICLEVGPGDEVITSPITFVSAVSIIEHARATPVFADVFPEDLTIDPESVRQRITKRTKAIIATHFAGFPAHMDELQAVADAAGVPLITDAAHAIETIYRGRPSGQLGRAACYSFYPTKNITSGEGGMLVTNEVEIADRARSLRLHGVTKSAWDRYGPGGYKHWDVATLGWKYNMSDIQGALGLAQLKDIWSWQDDRAILEETYRSGLDKRILTLSPDAGGNRWARHLFVVRVQKRDQVMDQVQKSGIGVGVHFRAVYRLKYYQEKYRIPKSEYPHAEKASEEVLSLPLYPSLTVQNVYRVLDVLHKVVDDLR